MPTGGSALGGVPATIIGSGFSTKGAGTLTVTFDGIAATDVEVLFDTTVSCMPPPGTPGTVVDVVVFNAIGTSTLSSGYTYAALPTVTGINPPSGTSLGGANVTVDGSGFFDFLPGPNLVTFDGVPATNVVVIDDNMLTCDAPPGLPGTTVDVEVQNVNGTGSLPLGFTYHMVPTLTSVVDPFGSSLGGTTVTLTGSGFQNEFPGPNTVFFDGVAATNVVVIDDTTLTCDTPPGAPASLVDVELSNANGVAMIAGAFLYHPLPTLLGVAPPNGSYQGGTFVTLTGTGFVNNSPGPNTVLFDGVPATGVVVLDDATLTCLTPPGVLGNSVDVEVQNGNGAAILPAAYLFTTEPSVLSVTPATGGIGGGTPVTVSGSGFVDDGAGANTVLFGGLPATNVVAVDDDTITCDTPAGLASGDVDVSVTNNNGTGTLPSGFSYFSAPTLASILPPAGTSLGGTTVTLTGSGFQNAGTNVVTFNGVPALSVVVVSDTTLTCLTPGGPAGVAVDVTLTNDNGSDTLSGAYAYHPLPTVTAVVPASGTSSGGTSVTLTGTGFQALNPGTNTVIFGVVAATNVVVVNDTTITCDAPGGSPGTAVNVIVSNNNGAGTLTNGFSYHALPTLTAVTPAGGTSLGGDSVTLTGTGFQNNNPGVNTVTFDGNAAANVVVVSDTSITCDVPAGTAGATVDVVVSNDNGSDTLGGGFTYHPLPTLTAVTPNTGTSLGGDSVTLTGTGFQNNNPGVNTVTFDGNAAANVVVVSDTSITCDVPAGTAGATVDVVVTNDNGSDTLPGGFTYNALPTLTAVTPNSGTSLGGASVTLTGTGFQSGNPGTNTVAFDGNAATNVVVVSDTSITCDVPAGTPGLAVDVVLTNDNGTDTLVGGFTYHALPTLTAVTPNTGTSLGGTSVTLTGTGFQNDNPGTNTVTFDGNAATNVVVVSDTSITCDVPAGTPGLAVDVVVTNDNGSDTLVGGYVYNALPTLTAVAPSSGTSLGGNNVTLTGSGFQNGNPGTNAVTFDGNAATNVVVVSDTSITCDVPAGAPGLAVDVVVTNDNGSDTLTGGYTYHPLPTLTAVTPSSGTSLGANNVTLTGTGFQNNSPGTNAVTFDGNAATNVVVVSDTAITCDVPAGTPGLAVDVVVSNDNGADTLVGGYTYHPLPTLTAVTPNTGTPLGGDNVTLTGTGFQNNSPGTNVVTFDGNAATNVVVVSDTAITCDVPAGTPGLAVDVVVSNDNGSDTLVGGFTYNPGPTLTAVTPNNGTALGGTNVTLTGTGFQNNNPGTNTVLFDGVAATNVVVVNDTTITCDTPAGTPGLVIIDISNNNGLASLAGGFLYHPLPTLTAVAPNNGTSLGGNGVTLTGTGFQNNSPGTNAVTFDGNAATNVVVVSDTSITCDVPAGTPGLAVDVVLSNDNGSDTLIGGYTYHPLPTLTAVTPNSGTSLGGNNVTLTGTGFQNNSPGTNAVTFDGNAATNVVVVSDTSITCDVPAGTPGLPVDVVVSNDNGSDTLASGYTYHPLPTLTAVTPNSGTSLGGNSVTLTGTGFQNNSPGTNTITFDGNAATNVVVVSDTSITCDVPAGTPGLAVDVVLSNDNGSDTLTSGYSYHPLPTLTAVTPNSGTSLGGNNVTLTGTGFQNNSPGTNVVTFDGNAATNVVVASDTSITCDVPAGTPGLAVDVVLSNDNGSDTLIGGYTYNPLPTLTAVLPAAGTSLGGTSVTLTGSGFQNAGTTVVTFNGSPALGVSVVNDTTITCLTPSGPAGVAVDVIVTNDNGTATLTGGYSYHPLPTLAAVTPNSGTSLGGTSVTLTGTGFQALDAGTNTVFFNFSLATNVVVVNDTTITCDTPGGAPGTSVNVIVSNDNGAATLVAGYGYHPFPTLTAVTPSSGSTAGGDNVTLTGTGFQNNNPGTNVVTFDGNAATNVVVVSDTSITCDTPAGTAGAVDVVVSNSNGSATLSSGYTYVGTVSASLSSVIVDIPFGALADGADAVTITVTVLDTGSNPVAGATVSLSATGNGNTLTPPSGTTNGSGVFTATITSTLAEVKTITATVNPGPGQVVLDDTPTTEFVWSVSNFYYVRATGNDANSGTSPADAWLSISQAASTLTAGETVFVGAGTYVESVDVTTSGTPGNPIRFVADRLGERTSDAGDVLIDSAGGAYTFRVNGGDYVEIEGFSLTGSTSGPGIRLQNGAINVVLRGNHAYANNRGFRLDDAHNLVFEDNRASNNTLEGVRHDAGLNAVMTNNLVYNNGNDGIRIATTATATLEGNTIYLNGDEGVHVDAGATCTIRNNIITDNVGDGINNAGSGTSSYNDVWNNGGSNWVPGALMGTGDFSADPLYEDPAGADLMLGGANAADDSFHLQYTPVLSPAYGAGSGDADIIVLSDGSNFGDKTTRLDDVLDGKSPDGDELNLGYHYAAAQGALASLAADDGRLVYGVGDTGAKKRPEIRKWDDADGTWSSPTLGFPVGTTSGITRGMVCRVSPLDNSEELLAILSEDPNVFTTEFNVHRWAGSEWVVEWSSPAIDQSDATKRCFDLEYEDLSSDAMVVYSDNTNTPVYRTRVQGVWSTETSLPLNDGAGPNPDPNSGTAHWIELEARPNSNEIVLLYADDNADLVAIVWDGSQWVTASAVTLETNLRNHSVTSEVETRTFDAAFEATTGDLIAVWSDDVASSFNFVWSRKPAGSNTWSSPLSVGLGNTKPEFIDLAAEPGTSRIAAGFMDMNVSERLGLATWNGSTWVNAGEYDSQTRDNSNDAIGDFTCAVGWVGNSGVAVCVYPDNNTGALDWARWTSAGGWAIQSDVAIAGKGDTESVQIETFPGQVKLMAVLSDSNNDLYSATYDGTTWTIPGGVPVDTDLFVDDSMPFSLDLKE